MTQVSTPRRSLLRAFMASSVGTALSRVLGLARELALANVLGAGMVMDAFVMAFTFPGMLRRFVADEGLTGALVPAIALAPIATRRHPGARRHLLTRETRGRQHICYIRAAPAPSAPGGDGHHQPT